MEVLRPLTRVQEEPTVDVRIHAVFFIGQFFQVFFRNYIQIRYCNYCFVHHHIFWESYVSRSMALMVHCRCSFSSLPRGKLWRSRYRATQNHFLGFVWIPDLVSLV